ncbi:hypothetical protein EV401DRAFT_1939228 [Pisolithus croceorrhizus]|nr:hypothetical protein EV401DRAFT_1939228 [Pisolithus croceorrhizus]
MNSKSAMVAFISTVRCVCVLPRDSYVTTRPPTSNSATHLPSQTDFPVVKTALNTRHFIWHSANRHSPRQFDCILS